MTQGPRLKRVVAFDRSLTPSLRRVKPAFVGGAATKKVLTRSGRGDKDVSNLLSSHAVGIMNNAYLSERQKW